MKPVSRSHFAASTDPAIKWPTKQSKWGLPSSQILSLVHLSSTYNKLLVCASKGGGGSNRHTISSINGLELASFSKACNKIST